MKKIQLILFGLLLFMTSTLQAQATVNVNFGTAPVWAPAERVDVPYYYLPDVDSYYDVPARRFIYLRNGKWLRSTSLPNRYRNYNLRTGNVVFLTDYRGKSPYLFHKTHKVKYPRKIKSNNSVFVKKSGKEYHKEKNKGEGKNNGKGRGKGNK